MYNPRRNQLPEFCSRNAAVTYKYDLRGNFTFLSEEGERLLGYSRDEACRMNIAELLDPEIAGQAREQIVRGAKARIGTVYEIDLIAKDGRRVPLEVSTQVVSRDGEPIEVQGIAVPSVIRSETPLSTSPRCMDESFFFDSSLTLAEIAARMG